jgi:hypothetical protein
MGDADELDGYEPDKLGEWSERKIAIAYRGRALPYWYGRLGQEKQIIGQWFFIPKNRTTEEASAANGKPVVMFREMPEGMTPAIQYYFYPTDLTGKEFIYPKDQALKIAAATHESVLATDSDASKGGSAHIFRVDPNGAEAQYDANATASNSENTNATTEPAPSTASLNSQADVNNSPASGPPAYSTAQNDQSTAATSGSSSDNRAATGTSGAYDQNQNASPRQQASAQLPTTASPLPLIGLLGLIAIAAGFGLRLARNTY